MAITDKINEIIDRRIGRNDFEGKGHLEVIKKKKDFFNEMNRLMDEYSTLRETIISQIKEQKGEYYVMSVEDPSFQEKVELTDGSIYSGKNILDTIGWYNVNSENKLHPVAEKESNQLGLYDMSGNIWEWCQDVYESQYKEGARKSLFSMERLPIENPQGGIVGDYRVIRGGSYRSKDTKCWVFYREKKKSVEASSDLGFRLVY